MALLGDLTYDTNEYDKDGGTSSLADGTYNVEIMEADTRTWDDGGIQLGMRMKVVDGPSEGASYFDNLQVVNANAQAQGIARAQLHKTCECIGIDFPVSDTEELLGGMLTIVLRTKSKGDKSYQNVVSRKPYVPGKAAANGASKTPVNGTGKAAAAPWPSGDEIPF